VESGHRLFEGEPGLRALLRRDVADRFWATQYPEIARRGRSRRLTSVERCSRIGAAAAFHDVMTHEDRLDQPLRWTKPRKVFVNSMSDLFHEDVPDAFIDRVFAVMALAPQHTFQILTKRAERMREYMSGRRTRRGDRAVRPHERRAPRIAKGSYSWPLPNVWLGVSVENQHFADERIPLLLQTPAAVRFISAEPLLGPVDLAHWLDDIPSGSRRLDWVIVGGESGPGARPFDLAWARSIVQQCQAAGVPVFVKQLGASAATPATYSCRTTRFGCVIARVAIRRSGPRTCALEIFRGRVIPCR
jgi:protein gp37